MKSRLKMMKSQTLRRAMLAVSELCVGGRAEAKVQEALSLRGEDGDHICMLCTRM